MPTQVNKLTRSISGINSVWYTSVDAGFYALYLVITCILSHAYDTLTASTHELVHVWKCVCINYNMCPQNHPVLMAWICISNTEPLSGDKGFNLCKFAWRNV